ncbi:contact-dependent growth inhibition system immunity protein [Pantoea septica]|uniref:contact-dependent growth inhibition system immunity protein n=1 Tax=Pantoea septica TaxID=472695 RepID=UPI000534B4AB|nr:contact-dependent growth inhibition system immunity protein [Pantoea septica]
MDKINISELDDLIVIYFGQDHDLIVDGTDIEEKIDAYIEASHKGMRHALIADIDLFLDECDNLDKDFKERYDSSFAPELWGTTPAAFLALVRSKITQSLQTE